MNRIRCDNGSWPVSRHSRIPALISHMASQARSAGRGALERQADPADRRVKALVLTPEGERLRDQFWRSLVTDPGPLTPLRQDDLCTLTRLLAKLDQPAD